MLTLCSLCLISVRIIIIFLPSVSIPEGGLKIDENYYHYYAFFDLFTHRLTDQSHSFVGESFFCKLNIAEVGFDDEKLLKVHHTHWNIYFRKQFQR